MSVGPFSLLLAAVPGILALIGASIGYGRLLQRLTTVERDLTKVQDLSDKVTRIDERTLNTDRQIGEIKGDINRLVENLIEEPARLFRNGRTSRPQG